MFLMMIVGDEVNKAAITRYTTDDLQFSRYATTAPRWKGTHISKGKKHVPQVVPGSGGKTEQQVLPNAHRSHRFT